MFERIDFSPSLDPTSGYYILHRTDSGELAIYRARSANILE